MSPADDVAADRPAVEKDALKRCGVSPPRALTRCRRTRRRHRRRLRRLFSSQRLCAGRSPPSRPLHLPGPARRGWLEPEQANRPLPHRRGRHKGAAPGQERPSRPPCRGAAPEIRAGEKGRRARAQPSMRRRDGGIARLAAPPQGQGRPASRHGAAVRRRRAPGRGLLARAALARVSRPTGPARLPAGARRARLPASASSSAITWWRRASASTGRWMP